MLKKKYFICLLGFLLVSIMNGAEASLPWVYKMDRQQGHSLVPEMIQDLKVGMTEEQVRYLLGSPTIVDSFHPDEWHYVYAFEKQGEKRIVKKLSLFFKEHQLAKIEKYGL